MKQYNLSKAIDKGRLLSKIYAELLKLNIGLHAKYHRRLPSGLGGF